MTLGGQAWPGRRQLTPRSPDRLGGEGFFLSLGEPQIVLGGKGQSHPWGALEGLVMKDPGDEGAKLPLRSPQGWARLLGKDPSHPCEVVEGFLGMCLVT